MTNILYKFRTLNTYEENYSVVKNDHEHYDDREWESSVFNAMAVSDTDEMPVLLVKFVGEKEIFNESYNTRYAVLRYKEALDKLTFSLYDRMDIVDEACGTLIGSSARGMVRYAKEEGGSLKKRFVWFSDAYWGATIERWFPHRFK